MAQDIRKMFQEDKTLPSDKLQKGHRNRFEERLEKAFPEQKKEKASGENSFKYLKIAAVLVVALGVGFFFFDSGDLFNQQQVVDTETITPEENPEDIPKKQEYQLSDVSPEFKKIENYYLASLNIELAKLEVTDENRDLVNAFMGQLAELDREYQRLNAEIKETGLNESSVGALITNLQLRLELLFKLKNKLKEIKQSKNKDYENYQA